MVHARARVILSGMIPVIEPTAGPYSPLFELRAWRLELDRMATAHAGDEEALEAIDSARREVTEWIRVREGRR